MFTDSVGGGGARSYRDGVDTCGNLVAPSYSIPNVERIESLFPVLYVYRKERPETAGAGKWRGGVGIEYMIVPHKGTGDIETIFFASAVAHCETKGASGGFPGSVQRHLVLRQTDINGRFSQGYIPLAADEVKCERLDLPQAKDATMLRRGDAWVCFCDGGGGYGDPLDRDPQHARLDVLRGLCTKAEVERLYGVKIASDGTIDHDSTKLLRARKRNWRHENGRRLGDDWMPGLSFEGKQLFRYGEILAVRATEAGPTIGCICCGHVLCSATEDPRQRALLVEESMSALSPLNVYARNEELVVREYCCPGCATVFSTDVQLRSDDPQMPEMLLSPEQFRAVPDSGGKPIEGQKRERTVVAAE
jgi:N-methylhydantoinase B